ncbi:MAG TPA: mandelate racemase/muconate lactonizing enzyme family protein [Anaerolineales bacterium]|jgi:glucarate dehydratase|nr:mandelate racemase/muconate lactonizing enzyme family protein [Anaerolineales bacterium]
MQITDILVHKVNLPLVTGYRWASGVYLGATKGIVEVRTDEGIVGWGEVATVEQADMVAHEFAPRLIGVDPSNIDDCCRRCVPEIRTLLNTHDSGLVKAFGGLELALWDIKGKALNQPIYSLLGGPVRGEIRFSEYFALRLPSATEAGESTPLEVARYCARMREQHGSLIFEGKVGVLDLDTEIAMVKEVRAAIGSDATLRLDANNSWPLNTARKALARLEPFDIANIEDPTLTFHDMAKLRQHSTIPFSSHLPDLRLAVELGVPDTFVLNVMTLGGLRETMKFISACELMGIGFWFYSGETAVGTAAYMQLAAAIPYLSQAGQSLFRWYADDVVSELIQTHANTVAIPDAPGLGVTIDQGALERCKARYKRDGVISQLGVPGEAHYRHFSGQ